MEAVTNAYNSNRIYLYFFLSKEINCKGRGKILETHLCDKFPFILNIKKQDAMFNNKGLKLMCGILLRILSALTCRSLTLISGIFWQSLLSVLL